MTELDPSNDIKTDKYALDEESVRIPYLIAEYDKLWHEENEKFLKYSAQLANLLDDLKSLKGKLAFKARMKWKEIDDFDKAPSDKIAENWVFTQPEYDDLIKTISDKRVELSEAQALENKYKNFHYALMAKKDKIDDLIRLYLNQYYSRPENIKMDADNKNGIEKNTIAENLQDNNEKLKKKMLTRKNK